MLAGLLAGSADDQLQGLTVLEVAPAPTSARLRVDLLTAGDPAAAEAALVRAGGWLRAGVADGINRRLVPELVFLVRGGD